MSATNTQFSVGVHVMTALAHHVDRNLISQDLVASVNAQPAVVRKVLSKLAKAGLVKTTRGKNGNTALAKPAGKITLLDIYRATQAPGVFAVHNYPVEEACVISRSHKEIMREALAGSQNAFETHLASKSLAQLNSRISRS